MELWTEGRYALTALLPASVESGCDPLFFGKFQGSRERCADRHGMASDGTRVDRGPSKDRIHIRTTSTDMSAV